MSEESVDVDDMYKFLIDKNYITNNIKKDLYSHTLKLGLNFIHTQYNNLKTTKSINRYIKDKNPNDNDFPFSFIRGDKNSTDTELTELERKKIFFLVFFPLYDYYNQKQDKDIQNEMTIIYYDLIPLEMSRFVQTENRIYDYDNYIERIKDKNYKNTGKPEFIDAYLFFIKKNIKQTGTNSHLTSKLMFASYTYLRFLINMLNDEIEWLDKKINDKQLKYENENDKKYFEKKINLNNDLNEVKRIIYRYNNATIQIQSNKSVTLKCCYYETKYVFKKFLEDNKNIINRSNYKYLSGENILSGDNALSLDDKDKIFIINFFINYVHNNNNNKNIIYYPDKLIYEQQRQDTYEDVLKNCISLLTAKINNPDKKIEHTEKLEHNEKLEHTEKLKYFDHLFEVIGKVFEFISENNVDTPTNWKELVDTVKNDIIYKLGIKKNEIEIEQKEKGGKKSRKRKHNKLKKKRKSTRKKRRKSNKKHR